MYFKCVGEVNGKADVEFFISSARSEEDARVLAIIATLGPNILLHSASFRRKLVPNCN
jgi:hypothetical protein